MRTIHGSVASREINATMKANGVSTPDLFGFVAKRIEKIEPNAGQSESTLIGRYAEFIVCAYLTKAGYNVIHIDTDGYDLIVEYEGINVRVDVKSTSKLYSGPFKQMAIWSIIKAHRIDGTREKTRRRITNRDCDLVALFYLPLDAVTFISTSEKMRGDARVPLATLRNDPQGIESFKNAANTVKGIGRPKKVTIP